MHVRNRKGRRADGTRSRTRAAGITLILAALTAASGTVAVRPVTVADADITAATASTRNPTGSWHIGISGRRAHFSGSATDPDTTGAVIVTYYLDGRGRQTVRTHSGRFAHTWTVRYGTHVIRIVALNVGAGTADTVIGSRRFTIVNPATRNPRGTARFARSRSVVHVRGIAYDPDRVHFRLLVRVVSNGRTVGATRTDRRSHHFAVKVALRAGTNRIRVVSYNVGAGTHNTVVGRATIRVRNTSWTSAYRGAQAIAARMVAAHGWGPADMSALVKLWNRESGWRASAANPSGAYGIPQALPGSKMGTAGADWRTNPATQIAWGLRYILGVYGSPRAAWGHSTSHGWY
jgi:hypothetical protein